MSWNVVIITRFNLYIPFGTSDDRKNLKMEWLTKRVRLFKEYCQPSVANQSDRRFRWLVMIDPLTPQEIVDELNALDCVEATPMEKYEYLDIAEVVKQMTPDADWVITANLDSDDQIHRQYVEDLYKEVEKNPPEGRVFLSFPNGYSVCGDRYYLRHYPNNQFHALAEPKDALETILCANHDVMHLTAPVRYLTKDPRWGTVIHDNNVGNYAFGFRVLHVDPIDFGLRRDQVKIPGPSDYAEVPIAWVKEHIRRTHIVGNTKRFVRKLMGKAS